jgi:predicted RNase H-like nuclease (RuvC/YqgF family)
MITYEEGLEHKIEDQETHIEALEDEIEELSCQNDSYEALCVEMLEQMVMLKCRLRTLGITENSEMIRFLAKYIKQLDEQLPEEEYNE